MTSEGVVMRDPFKPDAMAAVTQAGMAVLIDRLGGSVELSQADRDALAVKYGGAVGVKIDEIEPGRYRLSLVRVEATARPVEPERPIS